MAKTFRELVEEYQQSAMQQVLFTAWYGDDLPLCSKVLLHKVEKHSKAGDLRSIAMYMAMFLKEYPGEDLPSKVIAVCKDARLKRSSNGSVGYPHRDGTYHWFGK